MEDERIEKIIEGVELLFGHRISPQDLIRVINKSPVSDYAEE